MGKNADGANTEFRRRAQNACGDFTAVGDEDSVDFPGHAIT